MRLNMKHNSNQLFNRFVLKKYFSFALSLPLAFSSMPQSIVSYPELPNMGQDLVRDSDILMPAFNNMALDESRCHVNDFTPSIITVSAMISASVSVEDFGAKGDGQTNDTEAISVC